ncbi:14860_t:CDS:2, partial [Racocetra persica]
MYPRIFGFGKFFADLSTPALKLIAINHNCHVVFDEFGINM